jgi:hypothetical protein
MAEKTEENREETYTLSNDVGDSVVVTITLAITEENEEETYDFSTPSGDNTEAAITFAITFVIMVAILTWIEIAIRTDDPADPAESASTAGVEVDTEERARQEAMLVAGSVDVLADGENAYIMTTLNTMTTTRAMQILDQVCGIKTTPFSENRHLFPDWRDYKEVYVVDFRERYASIILGFEEGCDSPDPRASMRTMKPVEAWRIGTFSYGGDTGYFYPAED